MHVSGSTTNDNTQIIGLSGVIDVPFHMPAGVVDADVDLANRKVSINGRLIPPASTLCTIVSTGPTGKQFHITNRETAPWPAVCYVVVECPVLKYASANMSTSDANAAIANHEARLRAIPA